MTVFIEMYLTKRAETNYHFTFDPPLSGKMITTYVCLIAKLPLNAG